MWGAKYNNVDNVLNNVNNVAMLCKVQSTIMY